MASYSLADLQRVAWCVALNLTPNQVANISQNDLESLYLASVAAGGGSSAVSSVFTRTGAVVAATGDYAASQVSVNDTGLIVVTHTNVQGALADLDAAANLVVGAPVKDANGHIPESAIPVLNPADRMLMRTGAIAESFSRRWGSTLAAGTCQTGKAYYIAIPVTKGQVISDITFNAVAASITPTHWWFALYSSALTGGPLAISADQTTTVWAIGEKTLAMTAPYTVTADGYVYACVMQAAATPATISAAESGGSLSPYLLAPAISFVDSTNTGLTTPATAASAPVQTTGFNPLYAWLS